MHLQVSAKTLSVPVDQTQQLFKKASGKLSAACSCLQMANGSITYTSIPSDIQGRMQSGFFVIVVVCLFGFVFFWRGGGFIFFKPSTFPPSQQRTSTAHLRAHLFSAGKILILILKVPSLCHQTRYQLLQVVLIRIQATLPLIYPNTLLGMPMEHRLVGKPYKYPSIIHTRQASFTDSISGDLLLNQNAIANVLDFYPPVLWKKVHNPILLSSMSNHNRVVVWCADKEIPSRKITLSLLALT